MYFHDPHLAQAMARADVLVFDMNGLIVDDEPVQLAASNEALREAGFPVSITEQTWIARCVGRKPAEWIPDIIGDTMDPVEIARVVSAKDALYAKAMRGCAQNYLRKGVADLLAFAASAAGGKRLALASSTTRDGIDVLLGDDNLGYLSLFDCVISGDQVARAKPDPAIYHMVRDHFGGSLHYIVFEDAQSGVMAAAAAGMDCWAVPNNFTAQHDFSKAWVVIDNLTPEAKIVR